VLTQHLPNLEERSLIVKDNASYHNIVLEKPPRQSWRRDQIIAWLQEPGTFFPQGAVKAQLLHQAIATKSPRKLGRNLINTLFNPE